MYCPNCGAEATSGLKYCSRCGVSLAVAPAIEKRHPNVGKATGMFWAIALFGLGSFAIFMGGIIALAALNADEDIIIPAAIFGIAAILTISWLLIRQLARVISIVQDTRQSTEGGRLAESYAPPEIAESPPPMSVTEHTTRNFERLRYRDQRTRE